MGRNLGPRGELVSAYAGFNFESSVGTTHRFNSVDNEPGLNSGVKAVLRQSVDKTLYAVAHYATSAFCRIDTNLASFSISTRSSSS